MPGGHAASTHDLRQITAGHHGRWLVVDTTLEASGAPVHKLDGTLGLDGGNCGVHILRHDIATSLLLCCTCATFVSDSAGREVYQ